MSDPPRLLSTPSVEADLLDAWSSMRGPADGRAKALALAGLTMGAAATATVVAKGAATGVAAKAAGVSMNAGALVATTTATTATAGAGTAMASTGAGLLAAKWIAAIGIVAAVGGGSVVAAKKMSAPVTNVPPGAETTAIGHPSKSPGPKALDQAVDHAHEAAADRVVTAASAPPNLALVAPSEAIPVIAAADLPGERAPASTSKADKSDRTRVAEKNASARPPKTEPAVRKAAPTPEPEPEPAPAPVASTLGAEVSTLDAARNALRSGDPARALRELDAFDAKHPGSALAEDAAFLRFDANVALGDRAGADKAARSFLGRYPSSPHTSKVRRWLDGAK